MAVIAIFCLSFLAAAAITGQHLKSELISLKISDLLFLLSSFKNNQQNGLVMNVSQIIHELYSRDYNISEVQNDICSSYPPQILIPIQNDEPLWYPREILTETCRLHNRFVVPAILLPSGKYVFRSSSLWTPVSLAAETYTSVSSERLTQMRKSDAQTLDSFGVESIVSLMLEPFVSKFGFLAADSESNPLISPIYSGQEIVNVPYPGCEYFSSYTKANFNAHHLYYFETTTDPYHELNIRAGCGDINWSDYKKWNLPTLTANYLKALLSLVTPSHAAKSILIHCISGWDRTPLFISLLRLSLWADGIVHASLSPLEILYFTVAHDWMQYGHQLADRLSKGENVFHFCFHMLKHITDPSFSYFAFQDTQLELLTVQSDSRQVFDSSIWNDLSWMAGKASTVFASYSGTRKQVNAIEISIDPLDTQDVNERKLRLDGRKERLDAVRSLFMRNYN